MAATVHLHRLSARYTPENYWYGHEWRRMSRQCTHYGRWPQHDFTTLKKLRPQSVNSRIQPGSDVIVCAEMDEQWGYVGAKSRQRWLFYAYDRIRRTVVAHVFGERTLATLECCRPLRSWYGWRMAGRFMNHAWRENCTLSASDIRSALSGITWIWGSTWHGWDGSRCRSQNRWSCMTKSSGIIWT